MTDSSSTQHKPFRRFRASRTKLSLFHLRHQKRSSNNSVASNKDGILREERGRAAHPHSSKSGGSLSSQSFSSCSTSVQLSHHLRVNITFAAGLLWSTMVMFVWHLFISLAFETMFVVKGLNRRKESKECVSWCRKHYNNWKRRKGRNNMSSIISLDCTWSCWSSSSSYEENRYSVSRLQGRKGKSAACREKETGRERGQMRLSGRRAGCEQRDRKQWG